MEKRKTDEDSPTCSWVSYLLIAVLVLVAVIVILALIGPYIGYVYSNTGPAFSR